jgi:hypothetical protein
MFSFHLGRLGIGAEGGDRRHGVGGGWSRRDQRGRQRQAKGGQEDWYITHEGTNIHTHTTRDIIIQREREID